MKEDGGLNPTTAFQDIPTHFHLDKMNRQLAIQKNGRAYQNDKNS